MAAVAIHVLFVPASSVDTIDMHLDEILHTDITHRYCLLIALSKTALFFV